MGVVSSFRYNWLSLFGFAPTRPTSAGALPHGNAPNLAMGRLENLELNAQRLSQHWVHGMRCCSSVRQVDTNHHTKEKRFFCSFHSCKSSKLAMRPSVEASKNIKETPASKHAESSKNTALETIRASNHIEGLTAPGLNLEIRLEQNERN